nr:hypothetical protein [Paenibacillus aceti]
MIAGVSMSVVGLIMQQFTRNKFVSRLRRVREIPSTSVLWCLCYC